MATYNKHSDLIDALKHHSEKLESGELSLEELGQFQQLAQQLYERTIVLNFKAKEKFISTEGEAFIDSNNINDNNQEGIAAEVKEEPKSNLESVEGILFDFSSEASDDKVTNDEKSETSETELKKQDSDEESNQNERIDEVELDEHETPEQEEVSSDIISEMKVQVSENSAEEAIYSFYEKFTQVHDDSLMDQLSSQKIESLKGAFGLNDKFQIINELFNGNNEAFEKAIHSLDNQDSGQKARITLSEIAAQHQWEPDNLLVEDFAKMIERRYA